MHISGVDRDNITFANRMAAMSIMILGTALLNNAKRELVMRMRAVASGTLIGDSQLNPRQDGTLFEAGTLVLFHPWFLLLYSAHPNAIAKSC
jgi:hypothetical protein